MGEFVPVDLLGGKPVPPHAGDTWRANLFFVTNNPDLHSAPQGETGNGTRKNYCWSLPNGQDFHDTTHFGILQFVDNYGTRTAVTGQRLSLDHKDGRAIGSVHKTKVLCRNLPVDPGAVVVDCSGRTIGRIGVPENGAALVRTAGPGRFVWLGGAR